MIRTIGQKCAPVTASDTNYITDSSGNKVIGTLYVGTAGNLNVLPAEHLDTDDATTTGNVNKAVIFTNVPVGFFPIAVRKVFSTGTTASGIICNYN